jgi:hypothetical protein
MFRMRRLSLAAIVLAGVVLGLAAAGPAQAQKSSQFSYRLIDLGTFGGPQAGVANGPF